MKIINGTGITLSNYVLSGYYTQKVTGAKGKLYEFSSPTLDLSNFRVPYDAYLKRYTPTGDSVVAAAHRLKRDCIPLSDRTGALYFKNEATLIGGCHGYGHNNLTYYTGYNFYNAFYPVGYFAPPFGENISVFKANQDIYENLNYGSCNKINITEYNELFGIVSKTASDAGILSSSLPANQYATIVSPAEACPPEVAGASYFDEFQFTHIPGTTTALGANTHYNGNPIPTSLDSYDIRVVGRYETTTVDDTKYVVYQSQRPKAAYTADSQLSKLNNTLCRAVSMETRLIDGHGQNSTQILDAPDAIRGGIGDQINFAGANDFYLWHFTFKENAETLPFYNNFVAIEAGTPVRQRKLNEGTALFLPVLSSEESYWQNRQCPDTVDYLPYTFGASIYACPSEHFDVPYYAALRKFGFYGTRFLNTCKTLDLEYQLSGVENASEMPQQGSNFELDLEELYEPFNLDKEGNWSFPAYNTLLKIAKAEERYSNMYAFNKGFFIWANSGLINNDENFQYLVNTNPSFYSVYGGLLSAFQSVFESGLTSVTGSQPVVLLDKSDGIFTIIEKGQSLNVLTTNDEYLKFKASLNKILQPNELQYWSVLEQRYSNYVSNGAGINEDFYRTVLSGREKRIRTRYFENLLRGNVIDLFPMNNVTFSFDEARAYLEHTGWARRETTFGANSSLPVVNRRFFEGAYSKLGAVSGLSDMLNSLANQQIEYYYPGFFQDIKQDKLMPTPKYVAVTSGKIRDTEGRSFSPSGWLALGYNEVGAYDANFSCFTPIVTQQPLPTVFCKIGQQPTFRVTAVDYHTLPEDKINRRYPEISYWASKLKVLDCNGNNLYPLKYKWYRVKKDIYSGAIGDLMRVSEPSEAGGIWGCLEGDGPECTLCHPQDCVPTGIHRASDYTFIRGAIKNLDDQYYYYCTVQGRFGIRMTNPSELYIEDWIKFDVSVKNGINGVGNVKVTFKINDHFGRDREIKFSTSSRVQSYAGYQHEPDSAPETVVEVKVPPPNAGFGDVKAFRFIGPIAYVGATRSYTPSTLKDTRGLREVWGHLLDYGQLIPFARVLSQNEGEWLYGYTHLPVCENYGMADGKKGIQVIVEANGGKVGHWSLPQKAVASLDMKAGIRWDRLTNFGELYPPISARFESPNFGIGHWQWGNNLGAIKRFGKESKASDIRFVGGFFNSAASTPKKTIEDIKDKFIGPSDLAGENCGYTKYGLGRNMIYYLEAYERFYIICDPIKKKNVSNKSYINPGIRLSNSAIQYFWLGKPTNTYVKRRPMYGPYAFQWKVMRHNRDRNGNGMSESFYSMGHGKKYSLMYDAPAVYGLYVKKDTSKRFMNLLKRLYETKNELSDSLQFTPQELRRLWWGERGSELTARRYGDISYTCDASRLNYDKEICDYIDAAHALANGINFSDHSCSQDLLSIGECFDPCLSIRYAQGFFPGGKLLDLFNDVGHVDKNDKAIKQIKLIPQAKLRENGRPILGDERALIDRDLYFRSPLNTPHARISLGYATITRTVLTKDGKETSANEYQAPKHIGGISTCQDGGSDHCNYITPTMHLGVSSYLIGQSNAFTALKNYYANVYYTDTNIRGEIS
jgi:hypothetical protein